jgi:hypothetical protein
VTRAGRSASLAGPARTAPRTLPRPAPPTAAAPALAAPRGRWCGGGPSSLPVGPAPRPPPRGSRLWRRCCVVAGWEATGSGAIGSLAVACSACGRDCRTCGCIPAGFWERPEDARALAELGMVQVVRSLHAHTRLAQDATARLTDLDGCSISRRESDRPMRDRENARRRLADIGAPLNGRTRARMPSPHRRSTLCHPWPRHRLPRHPRHRWTPSSLSGSPPQNGDRIAAGPARAGPRTPPGPAASDRSVPRNQVRAQGRRAPVLASGQVRRPPTEAAPGARYAPRGPVVRRGQSSSMAGSAGSSSSSARMR